MNDRIIFLSSLLLSTALLFAQAPDTLWTKTYGGADNDGGYAVQQTSDSGYIITGWTYSFGAGGYDVYLIKTDSLGDTLWTRTYGTSDSEIGRSVQQTSDGGYIIAGNIWFTDHDDVYLIKTDSFGDTLWTKHYGGTSWDRGYSVQQTFDKGYIVAGYTHSFGAVNFMVYLIKTDSLGDTVWTKTYGGSDADEARSVEQTADHGYFIVGTTWSFAGGGYNDVWLLKTDSLGDTLWTKVYGGSDGEWGFSGYQTSDGGYIVTGMTESFVLTEEVYLIKTDSLGDTLWTRHYGSADFNIGWSVQQTTDTGYIIVGNTRLSGSDEDVYCVKTDPNGDTVWTKTYGGPDLDRAYSVRQTFDEGYIIAGRTRSFGAGGPDVWLLKISPEPGIKEGDFSYNIINNLEIMPNPFSKKTNIRWQVTDDRLRISDNRLKISIYDAAGQLVRQWDDQTIRQLDHVSWEGTDQANKKLPGGVYFLEFEVGDYTETKKLILLK